MSVDLSQMSAEDLKKLQEQLKEKQDYHSSPCRAIRHSERGTGFAYLYQSRWVGEYPYRLECTPRL